jgi:hypothetical protein
MDGLLLPVSREPLTNSNRIVINGDPALVGWMIKPKRSQGPAKRTIVFMHENAGHMAQRLDWFEKVIDKL